MQKFYKTPAVLLGLFMATLSLLSACKKDEADTGTPAAEQKLQINVFKNQTGSLAGEGLQAVAVDEKRHCTISVYGTFDAANNPLAVRSVTLQRIGSDTTTHIQANASTGLLESIYIDVRGVKQPVLLKASFVAGDTANNMHLGLYACDWQTRTGTLQSEANFHRAANVTTSTLIFTAHRTTAGWPSSLQVLLTGIALAGTIDLASALLTPAIIAAVAPVAATVATFALNVALMAILMNMFINQAQAATPGSTPYPPGVPPTNPNPNPNLPSSPCAGAFISFRASMDGFGHILVAAASGGTAPYSYAVDNHNFQSSEVFSGTYANGSHLILVRSNTGCVSAQVVPLSRILTTGCLPPAQLQLLTGGSSKTWRFVRSTYTFFDGSPPIINVGAVPIRYTFNVSGQCSYDTWTYDCINGNPADCFIILDGTGRTLTESFCPKVPIANGISIIDRDRIIMGLTATSLETRLTYTGGDYETYNFVAP